jgi:hypothetical protein
VESRTSDDQRSAYRFATARQGRGQPTGGW